MFKSKLNKKNLAIFLAPSLAALLILVAAPVHAQPACKIKNPSPAQLETCLKQNPIIKDLQLVVNFLSAGVGVIVVGVIILGGVQYATAGENPQRTANAKQRVINGLIALLAFIFTFAFLQWLIPGGIFK